MLIGICSDSHDNLPAIRKAVEEFNRKGVDLVLHAGDYISPFAVEEFRELNCELHGILGNNDGEKKGVKEAVKGLGEIEEGPKSFKLDGKKILLSHKPPEEPPENLDLLVHGHTHEPKVEKRNGNLVVNPGECSGWLTGNKTVATVDLEEMEAEILTLG